MEARTLLRPTSGPHSRNYGGQSYGNRSLTNSCNVSTTPGKLSSSKGFVGAQNATNTSKSIPSTTNTFRSSGSFRERNIPQKITPSSIKASRGRGGGIPRGAFNKEKKEGNGRTVNKEEKDQMLKKLTPMQYRVTQEKLTER